MVGQDGERDGVIDPHGLVRLYWDIDQPIEPAALTGVPDQPRSDAWSGVTVGGEEPFDGIWLRLAATEPGTCRLAAEPAAIETGMCDPIIPIRTLALAVDASLAYLTPRRAGDGERPWELGAIGHGPAGRDLADRLCAQVRAWGTDRTTQPVITAYQAGTPDERLGALVNDKPNTRLIVTF